MREAVFGACAAPEVLDTVGESSSSTDAPWPSSLDLLANGPPDAPRLPASAALGPEEFGRFANFGVTIFC